MRGRVFRRLLDGVDPQLVYTAEQALADQSGVQSVRSLRMRRIGHRLHADAELDVDPTLSLREAHRIVHDAEHELTHAAPKLTSGLIHAYPAQHTKYVMRVTTDDGDDSRGRCC